MAVSASQVLRFYVRMDLRIIGIKGPSNYLKLKDWSLVIIFRLVLLGTVLIRWDLTPHREIIRPILNRADRTMYNLGIRFLFLR